MTQPSAPGGFLLINLGTPDAPDRTSLRRYLAEFLSDRRVVDLPRLLWLPILHSIILNRRPQRSAMAYQKIWSEQGSPLLAFTMKQAKALATELAQRGLGQAPIEVGMRYGNPSIESALDRLLEHKVREITVLPLYPQYSAATTASTFDQLARVLMQRRNLPTLHFLRSYPDHPGYIEALKASVLEHQLQHGIPDKLLISFHGIPQRYADAGDPYPQECESTAIGLAQALGLQQRQWQISYQSRFGREPWLQPYTDQTLQQWGADGVRHVQVICPGFSADCLETLEEIGEENRDYFLQAGGEHYSYIPALNDRPDHITLLADLLQQGTNR